MWLGEFPYCGVCRAVVVHVCDGIRTRVEDWLVCGRVGGVARTKEVSAESRRAAENRNRDRVFEKDGEAYSADSVVLGVVGRFLDIVASHDRSVTMVVVRGPGGEIDLLQELLLMMLEFAHHLG